MPLKLTTHQKVQARLAHEHARALQLQIQNRELDKQGKERLDMLRNAVNALEMFILAEPA